MQSCRCAVAARAGLVSTVLLLPSAIFGQTASEPPALSTGGIQASHKIGQPLLGEEQQDVESGATLAPRYKKKLMSSWTEYNPGNCTEISPGSWSVTSAPKYGKVSTGTISGHLSNGDCPSTTFTFAAIYYTWLTHSNRSNTDSFQATWTAPDFTYPFTFDVTVRAVRPASEKTAFAGWYAQGPGKWQQTLVPPATDPNFKFGGETVQEFDAGGGSDTCWFKGSAYAPFTKLSGGTWTVSAGNKWSFDYVGWLNPAIIYYRAQNRAPCGFTVHQQMKIKSPVDKNFVAYAKVNTLIGSFTKTTVTSQRAGSKATHTK